MWVKKVLKYKELKHIVVFARENSAQQKAVVYKFNILIVNCELSRYWLQLYVRYFDIVVCSFFKGRGGLLLLRTLLVY